MANDRETRTADDLGERIALFGPRKSEGVAAIILAVFFSVGSVWAGILFLAPDFAAMRPFSRDSTAGPFLGESTVVLAVVALFVALGVGFFRWGQNILFFYEIDFREDGLVVRQRGETVRLLWVYLALIRPLQSQPSITKKPTTLYILITKQGKEHHFGYQDAKEFDRFGQLLWEYSRRNGVPWETAGN